MNHVTPLKRPAHIQLAALTVTAAFSLSALLTSATDNGIAIMVSDRVTAEAGYKKVNLGTAEVPNMQDVNVTNTSTVNFNGTQLIVGANSVDWIQGLVNAVIGTGGAKINTNGFTIGVSQAFSGTGDFTKSGTGTLYMNGVNTYTGTTYVTGGTLGGTGTFAGALVVSAGATLAPGQSVGTLYVASATLESGAILAIEIGTDGSHDIVNIAAGETFAFVDGAELHISVDAGAALYVGDTLNIFTGPGSANGWEDITILSDNADYSFGWTNGQLEVLTAVPELSTYTLLGALGLAGVIVCYVIVGNNSLSLLSSKPRPTLQERHGFYSPATKEKTGIRSACWSKLPPCSPWCR